MKALTRVQHLDALSRGDTQAQEYTGPVHYFASNALAWATGDTREEAIEKAIRHAGTAHVKRITANLHKNGQPGFYCWSVKVFADRKAEYTIDWFTPQGVELEAGRHHDVTHITAKALKYITRVK